jgi:hypothetical protein
VKNIQESDLGKWFKQHKKNKAMKKTLRKWFEMFPEPYRTQAIENTIELEGKARLEYTDKNAVEAINGGFVWKQSPQGHDYWSEFAFKIYRNEIVLTERAERMYSEEEVERICFSAMDYKNEEVITLSEKRKWFEQHKKTDYDGTQKA